MGARDLLHELDAAGFSVRVEDGAVLIKPASKLTADICAAVRAEKAELMMLVELRAALAAAINRACAARGDDDANRIALLAECAERSPEDQADLIAHFTLVAIQYEAITRGSL